VTPVRTLLVDDNQRFLAAASRLLATWEVLVLVGCVDSGADAVDAVQELRPELVVMDLMMPGMSGLEALTVIKGRPDAPRVVIVTLDDSVERRAHARVAGADAVIGKSGIVTDLLPVIREMFDRDLTS
jgi:CheY-like chemotaxis protein